MIRATTPWLAVPDLLAQYDGLYSYEARLLAAVTAELGLPPSTYGVERVPDAPGRVRFAATWTEPFAVWDPAFIDPPLPDPTPDPLPAPEPDPRPDPPPLGGTLAIVNVAHYLHRSCEEQGIPVARCRSCGALIWWALSKAGKRTPYNVDPATRHPLAESHFRSCPQAAQWSKQLPRRGGAS